MNLVFLNGWLNGREENSIFYNVDAWNLYINNISDLAHKTSRDVRIWSIFSQFNCDMKMENRIGYSNLPQISLYLFCLQFY